MSLIDINWKPDNKALRQFGMIGLGAFGALGAWVFFRHHLPLLDMSAERAATVAYGLWALSAVCGLLAGVAPRGLLPLYIIMTAISLPIGLVVSHVMMGILFYGVFTPVALVFKLIGRDAMKRSYDPSATTYWIERPKVIDVKRYYRQF